MVFGFGEKENKILSSYYIQIICSFSQAANLWIIIADVFAIVMSNHLLFQVSVVVLNM